MAGYYNIAVVVLLVAILALQIFSLVRKTENYGQVSNSPMAAIIGGMKTHDEDRMKHKIDLDKLVGNTKAAAYDESMLKKDYGITY